MNISFDLIIPPIIMGILMTMIISSNRMMMESSVENQVTYQLQSTANNGILVVQEEVRSLNEILVVSDSTLNFVETDFDTVMIVKQGEYLEVSRTPVGGVPTTQSYYLKLDSIDFQVSSAGAMAPTFLSVTAITKSSPQQVGSGTPHKAVASRDLYLRNLQL